jgi:hypothetical protein
MLQRLPQVHQTKVSLHLERVSASNPRAHHRLASCDCSISSPQTRASPTRGCLPALAASSSASWTCGPAPKCSPAQKRSRSCSNPTDSTKPSGSADRGPCSLGECRPRPSPVAGSTAACHPTGACQQPTSRPRAGSTGSPAARGPRRRRRGRRKREACSAWRYRMS